MTTLEALSHCGKVIENESMKKHTTYRIGGNVDYYIEPDSQEHLIEALKILNAKHIPFLVIGKGSNILVSDRPFHGAFVCLNKGLDHFSFDGNVLTAQAGCSLIVLAKEAADRSLSGLEFASGIPGSIGGGLYMNAGAYRSDLSQLLIDVLIWRNGKLERVPAQELEYEYRRSAFQKHRDWIVIEGRFQLVHASRRDILALMDSRKQRRLSSQPVDKPCAGSVFRNPDGCNAWKIVDDLGFRGKRLGGARVSEIHSNFIVNEEGNALAKDVDGLIRTIQREAKRKFGVDLITEVERINWDEEKED